MKKFLHIALALLLVPMAAMASKYEEGKHYEVVSQEASKKPEVREYFSFYCPACYRFEPVAGDIKKALPENVAFVKNHVDFLPGVSTKMQGMLTRVMVVGEQLGISDQINAAIFNQIHVNRAVFTSQDDLKKIFVAAGIDGKVFDNAMKSFTISGKVKQQKKNQTDLSRSRALKSVPTVIVNGKYKVLTTHLDKNDQMGDYNRLVQYLTTLK